MNRDQYRCRREIYQHRSHEHTGLLRPVIGLTIARRLNVENIPAILSRDLLGEGGRHRHGSGFS